MIHAFGRRGGLLQCKPRLHGVELTAKHAQKGVLNVMPQCQLLFVQMHAVARNLFTFLVSADLASAEGLATASAAADMVADDYPVRVGILPSLPDAPGGAQGHHRGLGAQGFGGALN